MFMIMTNGLNRYESFNDLKKLVITIDLSIKEICKNDPSIINITSNTTYSFY